MSNSSPAARRRLLADSAHRPKLLPEDWRVLVMGICILIVVGGIFAFALMRGLSSTSWFKVATENQSLGGGKEVREGQEMRTQRLKPDQCKRSILDRETGHMIDVIRLCGETAADATSETLRQGADRWHR